MHEFQDFVELCLPEYEAEVINAPIRDYGRLLTQRDYQGRGPIITLSPDEALALLQSIPSSSRTLKRKVQHDDRLKRLKLRLIDTHKNDDAYWSIYHSIKAATVITFQPIIIHELTIDIDGNKVFDSDKQIAAAREIAHEITEEIFALAGWKTFIEPSRNGKGIYVRFRIQRTSDPVIFNDLIGRFQRLLRDKFNVEGAAAKVDKVGGRLLYHFLNPLFNKDLYDTVPEGARLKNEECYQWKKRYHGLDNGGGRPPVWVYDSEMEPVDYAGGDLMTKALHNLPADSDGGTARVSQYRDFCKSPAQPERLLAALTSNTLPDDSEPDDEDVSVPTVRPAIPDATPRIQHRSTQKSPNRVKRPDLDIFLDAGAESQSRYLAATRIVLRDSKPTDKNDPVQIDALIEAVLETVESPAGPANGPRHHKRIERVCDLVDHLLPSFDLAKCRPRTKALRKLLFDPKVQLIELERVVKDRISGHLRREGSIKFGAGVTFQQLTAGLAFYLNNIHSGNLTEVSAKSIIAGCASIDLKRSKADAAAIRWLLTRKQVRLLIQIAEHIPPRHGMQGKCARFELHPDCPIPAWLSSKTQPIVQQPKQEHPARATPPSHSTIMNISRACVSPLKDFPGIEASEPEYWADLRALEDEFHDFGRMSLAWSGGTAR